MTPGGLSAIVLLEVGLPIVLAGCESGNGSTGTGNTANVLLNGSVKWAVDMSTQTGYAGDPTAPNNQSLGVIQRLVYDSLLRADGNDRLHPGLADSVVATDPTTVTINLHPRLKFTDGTPLDAAAVQV